MSRYDQLQARLKQLEAENLESAAFISKHQEENRIKWLTTPPNKGWNPLQERIVNAWLKPELKTFAMTGGNRLGKTMLCTNIGQATMFGKKKMDAASLDALSDLKDKE